jgi:hypothetical protein
VRGDEGAPGKSTGDARVGLWGDVVRHWAAIEADLAREYGLDELAVAALSLRRFLTLLRGLSPESLWRHALRDTPQIASSPEEAAAALDRL